MHRGAYQDAYGSRNAHLRRNHAPLTQPVVHLRRSELVRGWWGITAELSRNISSEHHKYSAGPICMHRGAYQDAYGSRNAHLRQNHAPLAQPVVHLRRSEPVRGWGFPAELSRSISSEHRERLACAKAAPWRYCWELCRLNFNDGY